MPARRRYAASSSVLSLLLLVLATARVAVTSRDLFPICTSMCEDPAANAPNSRTVPCIITPTCASGRTVPIRSAPGSPVNVTVRSDSEAGPDSLTYLNIASQWYTSEVRISKLTGFEVRVICASSGCLSGEFCFTMHFNRSLTAADAGSKFSVSCLFGNFSVPSMQYSILARSLPHNIKDTNRVESKITLPSCTEKETVALCRVSMEHWMPTRRPMVSLTGTRTVAVAMWPKEGVSYLAVQYKVYLQNNHTRDLMGPEYTNNTHTVAKFYDVPDGTYFALMKVSECDDCMLFKSSNTIQIPALEPTLLVPTTHTSQTPRRDISKKDPPASGSVLILYVVGGCLGGIFLVLVVSIMACSSKFHTTCCSSVQGKSKTAAIDPSTRSIIQSNNGRYERTSDTDTIYRHSNGHYDYYLDSAMDNPSMIPHTVHEDWKQTNGHLLRESNRYAEMIGQGKGDSISTTVLDIQSTVTVPSSVQIDSGFRSYSDIAEEDGERVLSLALTDVGESV
ncbi:uncharacterized protein [Diadema antillarum]|uniref:uncharacterized protein n=1 Tax=Diadema antillarum TaxID=105358 RepID=UPI003A8A3B37